MSNHNVLSFNETNENSFTGFQTSNNLNPLKVNATSEPERSFGMPIFAGFDEETLNLTAPYVKQRRISKAPFKVLDAPALQDDFYLNLVDWSSTNILAVGLGPCIYLWSA